MARFDTPVQDKEQSAGEYLRWSKDIDNIPANQAQAKLYEGVDTAITEGAKEGNKWAEQSREDIGREAAEGITKAHLASLENEHNTLYPGQTVGTQTADTLTPDKNATGYNESQIPQDIKDGLNKGANIRAAREQGGLPGHTRDVEYMAQIYQEAQRLRNQNPTYRDYIDKGFEKVTGFTPNANAYRKALIAEINEAASKKNDENKKIVDEAWSTIGKGGGGQQLLDGIKLLQAGKIDRFQLGSLLQQTNKWQNDKAMTEAAAVGYNFNDKQWKDQAADVIPNTVAARANIELHNIMQATGMTKENLEKFDNALATGQDPTKILPAEQFEAAAQLMRQRKTQLMAELQTEFNAPIKDKDGNPIPSWRRRSGEDFDKHIASGFKIYDSFLDSLANKDSGGMHAVTNLAKAISDRSLFRTLNDSGDVGDAARTLDVFKRLGGEQIVAGMFGSAGGPAYPDAESFKLLLRNAGVKPPNAASNVSPTMGSDLKIIERDSKGGASPTSVNEFVNGPAKVVTDPRSADTLKKNMIEHVIQPGDNWLARVKQTYDKPGEDRHNVFSMYTSRDFAKEVDRLTDTNPNLRTQWQDWVLTSWRNDIAQGDILRLKGLQVDPTVSLTWNTPPGEAPYFKLERKPNVYRPFEFSAESYRIHNEQIHFFNQGIASVYNVTKDRTASEVMRIFESAGIDTSEANSVFSHMGKAIESSRKPIPGSKKNQDSLKQP